MIFPFIDSSFLLSQWKILSANEGIGVCFYMLFRSVGTQIESGALAASALSNPR